MEVPEHSILVPDFWGTGTIVAGFSTASRVSAKFATKPGAETTDLGINTQTPPELASENRNRFLQNLGIIPGTLAYARQVHGTDVRYVEKPGFYPDSDGLVTDQPNVALGILVADCAAVLVADPENRVIGAFHVGWRGAAGGILHTGIGLMRKLGARRMLAWVSPCIGADAFEVGEEVAVRFPESYVIRTGYKKPHIHLKGYIRHQLMQEGFDHESISVDASCTFHDRRFHSYRRDGNRSGRMMGVIQLRRDTNNLN